MLNQKQIMGDRGKSNAILKAPYAFFKINCRYYLLFL